MPSSPEARRVGRARVGVVVLCAAMLATACARGGPAAAPATNVVLISIDCMNQRQYREAIVGGYVPTIAGVSDDALVFSRAHSHAPWTTPAHMSMLTGLYPTQHGRDVPWSLMVKTNAFYDRVPQFPTMAARLAAAGHETVAFVGKGSISGEFGLAAGFDVFEESAKVQATDLGVSVERALAWLERRSPRPFFLFFHTYDLHDPRQKTLASDEAMLGHIDGQLGRIVAALKQKGLYDSTLIVITGDHGSAMHASDGQCCVHGAGHYEENLNVPLVVKLPGSSAKGKDDRVVRHVDIFPTVMAVLGLSVPEYRGPGVSVLALSQEVESRLSFSSADARCMRRYALADGRYKYIYTPRDEVQWVLRSNPLFLDRTCVGACAQLSELEELYDLEADPGEERNLLVAGVVADASTVVAAFRERMAAHLNLPPQYARTVVGSAGPVVGPDLQEALKALGYVR
jgi:arylsulfatase A-like enzyme